MIFQVRANLFFAEEDEARDFFHDCELAWYRAHNVNPGQENAELSIAELIENHHDDDPNSICSVISVIPSES